MAVSSLLSVLASMEGSLTIVSNNTRYGGGQGGSANTDIFIADNQSVGRRSDNVTNHGMGVTTPTTNLTGTHAKFWCYVTQWAQVTSLQVLVASGSAAGAGDIHTVPTSQYPPLFGFIPVWVNIDRTADLGGPANPAGINECGQRITIGDVGGNAQNNILDEVNYGTSGLLWTGTSGNFGEFATYDTTNREGAVVEDRGTIFCFSRLEIGNGVATTSFSSTNEKITFVDQSLVAADWMGITFDNTRVGDSFSITGTTIDSSDVINAGTRGDLIINGNANAFPIASATIDGLRLIQLSDSVTITGGTIGGLELTQGGATLTGGLFINCNTAANVAYCDDFTPADADNIEFVQVGAGHAIRITTPGTYDYDNIRFTDFGGTGGTNSTPNSGPADAAIFNDSGGAVTINVNNGGDQPSVRNGAGATTTVQASVPINVKASLQDGTPVEGASVYIITTDAIVIGNGLTDSNGDFVTSYSGVTPKTVDAAISSVRSGSGATPYQDFPLGGSITASGYNATATLTED